MTRQLEASTISRVSRTIAPLWSGANAWEELLQQAYSFLPHDPVTAAARLRGLRQELEQARARGERGAAGWTHYAESLLARAQAAERAWLAASAERERQFRLREAKQARAPIEALRRPSGTGVTRRVDRSQGGQTDRPAAATPIAPGAAKLVAPFDDTEIAARDVHAAG